MQISYFLKSIAVAATFTLLTAGVAQSAFSDTIMTGTNGPNNFTNGSWVFSDTFAVTANSTINSLGYYDNGDTNHDSHMVGLYDSLGNLLASANIAAGNNYSNNFDWKNISAISLIAGNTYTIAGVSNSDDYGYYGVPSTSSLFTFVSAQYNFSTTLIDPQIAPQIIDSPFNGPNAEIVAAVPEPMTPALIGLGLLVLIPIRRKAKP